MKPIAWSQINWPSVVLNAAYVWVLALAVAFFGRLFGLDRWRDFVPALTVGVALVVVWVSYRVALRAGQQPILHGLLVGLLVAIVGLVLNALSIGVTVVEIAGFLMQVLGGLLGGRMAQRRLLGV